MLFGTFDILHSGHLNLFYQARKFAKKLIVVVARDINVEKVKHKKPVFNEKERVEILKNIRLVDEVLLGNKVNPYKIIKRVNPDIIALGYDQKEYVKNLDNFLKKNKLSTKIIRLKSYQPAKYKSHKIRQQIDSSI